MNRILFVDDELPVLEGLRYRLHRLSAKWRMRFVLGGVEALEAMRSEPPEVIVCDMRMPGMDGTTLLESVSRAWPQTVRIVLSGYSEVDPTMRILPYAHQYLNKPCQPQQLEQVIERCLLLQELLGSPRLRAIVGRIRALPSPPRVYTQLQAMARDESVTLREASGLVASDSALAARVLQVVNSAFFRLARRITKIEDAVSYLGFTTISHLALSLGALVSWPASGPVALNLNKLQTHAQAVAAAAMALTSDLPMADDAMLAGLLHDIGYWVLAQECPAELRRAIELAVEQGLPLHAAESQVIGASHAEIGAYLLGIWGLPYPVVEAVAHHHVPQRVAQTEFDVLAAVAVAHSLAPDTDADAWGHGSPAEAGVDAGYLNGLHAPFDWNTARQRVADRMCLGGDPT